MDKNFGRCVDAFQEGADDYILKTTDSEVLWQRILARMQLRDEQSVVGDLHRMGNQSIQQPPPSHHFCPECLTCVREDAPTCPSCQEPRHRWGWCLIEGSPFPELGQIIGQRYHLVQGLGRGSTGRVYRAVDLDLGRAFAVKAVDLTGEGDLLEEARLQILDEIQALVRVDSPYVVKLYQVVHIQDETYGLVMELAIGRTLAEVLDARVSLPVSQAVQFALMISQALSDIHAHGILHLDVKPANIVLDRLSTGRYHVRLLDFGIARFVSRPSSHKGIFGTPAYISPEQLLMEEELDARTDIYALGVMLYQMLAGQLPFSDDAPTGDLFDMHLNAPIPPLPEEVAEPQLRSMLDGLIAYMMAKQMSLRPVDARQVSRILRKITAHIPTPRVRR